MIAKTTARLLSIDSLLFFIVLFAGLLFWHAVVISESLVGSLNFISSTKLTKNGLNIFAHLHLSLFS